MRAAWRRIAAATHPDRADGGDPGRFAVAAAAYTVLRTRSGRGEALADLAGSRGPAPLGHARPGHGVTRQAGAAQPGRGGPARLPVLPPAGPAGRQRPGPGAGSAGGARRRLALRVLIAAAVSARGGGRGRVASPPPPR